MHQLFTSIYGRLLLALIVSVLLMSIGNALIFDRVFMTLLVVATLVSFTINKDTFSILLIVCLFHGFEELHWLITEDLINDVSSFWLKSYCYGLCFWGCYLQRNESLIRWVLIVVIIAACFEVYWLISNLPGKEIYWYILTCAIALLVRYLLFWRPHILHRKFPDIVDWTFSRLDADFELFLKLLLILESLMITEYLVRYTMENNQIIYIYYSYSYFIQTINLYLLLSTFLEIKRNYFNRHLGA